MRIREDNEDSDYLDKLRTKDSSFSVIKYEPIFDDELSDEDAALLYDEIRKDMTKKSKAGLTNCHINDSDASWYLDDELDDACEKAFEKLENHNTLVIDFFGDEDESEDDDYDPLEEDLDYDDDEELEESYSKKRDSYHRFLEGYLDSLERRQERLR